MSDHKLDLDDYEASNLLWLLRVARRVGLDTGDWCGQLKFKLEALSIRGEPNYPKRMTDKLVERLGGR